MVRMKQNLGRWAHKSYELLWRLMAARRTVILPAPATETASFAPVFVIGCPRSGTTLLRMILDSHPNVASPPETFFLLDLEKMWVSDDAIKGLAELGYDREHVRSKVRDFAAYFLATYAASRGKGRLVEKTPHYVACLDFIEELFAPRSQYIMLYRHPLDVVVSMNRHFTIGWHPLLKQYLDRESEPLLGYAHFWADHVTKMLEFEAAHPDRCQRLRYEDLVAQPEQQMRAVFAFMGEPWHEEVLNYHKQPHDQGRGDRKALMAKGIAPSVGNWQDLDPALVEQIQDIVRMPARHLGYDCPIDGVVTLVAGVAPAKTGTLATSVPPATEAAVTNPA
jgi:protein-tyrosine sulfotransferase